MPAEKTGCRLRQLFFYFPHFWGIFVAEKYDASNRIPFGYNRDNYAGGIFFAAFYYIYLFIFPMFTDERRFFFHKPFDIGADFFLRQLPFRNARDRDDVILICNADRVAAGF